MNSNGLLPFKLSGLAAKQLKKIRKTDRVLYDKVHNAITTIRQDPNIGDPKKGDLKGYSCIDISHLRTNYELCYTMKEDANGQLILVIMMGPRENFYHDLKRYLNS
ncbi:type II toxin-antitoxin system RelE/ParE family toxin [Neobacillus sp. SM06]|uniref:type II toxin-antitoxin system RelE/ParE family toxin n=1 Tax=Neobacillus sp. SM06 TaxID=3422492 RepID=UPI003D275CA5